MRSSFVDVVAWIRSSKDRAREAWILVFGRVGIGVVLVESCVSVDGVGESSREINRRTSVHSASIVPIVTVGMSSSSSSRSSWKAIILWITPGVIVARSSIFSRREWAKAGRK